MTYNVFGEMLNLAQYNPIQTVANPRYFTMTSSSDVAIDCVAKGSLVLYENSVQMRFSLSMSWL